MKASYSSTFDSVYSLSNQKVAGTIPGCRIGDRCSLQMVNRGVTKQQIITLQCLH